VNQHQAKTRPNPKLFIFSFTYKQLLIDNVQEAGQGNILFRNNGIAMFIISEMMLLRKNP